MGKKLTKRDVDALKPVTALKFAWDGGDGGVKGFGVKVTPTGRKVFLVVYRFPRGRAGKVRRYTIGTYGDDLTVDQARRKALDLRADIARNIDPMAVLEAERRVADALRKAPKRSVETICTEFVARYSKANNRSWAETERILKRHVVPAWGRRQIADVTRSDVNDLLDQIEDASGAPMATAVLAQIRKMFNWHATRDGKFNTPIVRGMARTSPKKQKRKRVLSDDEIRLVWEALGQVPAPFCQLVRFLLVTAQRRSEVSNLQHDELSADLWTIPPERYKTDKALVVPLSALAIEQLEDTGELADLGDYMFTTTGDKPFSGFSKAKAELDETVNRILAGRHHGKSKPPTMKPWVLHDLRRTAKTLMQRAGVRPDISERVLGHVIAGVEGTYDQHAYLDEKRHALNALASEMRRILHGPQESATVLRMKHKTA